MKKIILLFILLLTNLFIIRAQSDRFPLIDRVKNEMNPDEIKKIHEAEKKMIDADMLMEEANKMDIEIEKYTVKSQAATKKRHIRKYERKKRRLIKKVSKRRFKASGIYEHANDMLYRLLKDKLRQFRPSRDEKPKIREVGKLWEKEAGQHFSAGRILRRRMNREDEIKQIGEQVKHIQELEVLGLNKQMRALGLYLNWPDVIEKYKEDLEAKEQEQKEVEEETVEPMPDENTEEDADIVFRIQILAVKKPVAPNDLTTIYNGAKKVNEYNEDGWFKYTLGNFDNYNDAVAFKETLGIYDSFVVAYKNGQRIDIQEALR